jgi:hypothetical protein
MTRHQCLCADCVLQAITVFVVHAFLHVSVSNIDTPRTQMSVSYERAVVVDCHGYLAMSLMNSHKEGEEVKNVGTFNVFYTLESIQISVIKNFVNLNVIYNIIYLIIILFSSITVNFTIL